MTAADDLDPPKPDDLLKDPDALKGAHERSGRLFQKAGLPFEEEEFDEDAARESESGGSGGATGPATDEGPSKD
jgi:hypothetical protein